MRSYLAALVLATTLAPGRAPAEPPLLGFGPARAAEERSLESRFDEVGLKYWQVDRESVV